MFLGFVGGGRRGQESWVALKLTVCSVAAAAVVVAGGIAASSLSSAVPYCGALLLCCLPPSIYRSCTSLLSPAVLSFGGILSFLLTFYFVRADAVLLHG